MKEQDDLLGPLQVFGEILALDSDTSLRCWQSLLSSDHYLEV